MGEKEKKYLIKSLVLTVIVIALMAIVAIALPKTKIKLILVIEIALAIIWTIISAINVVGYLKENKQ